MVCGSEVWLSAVDIPATLFHLSVLLCVAQARARGLKQFRSAFFLLFIVISSFDVSIVAMVYVADRINSCGYMPSFYDGNLWLSQIYPLARSYVELFQFLGHLLMSANRFTVLVLPSRMKWMWKGKSLAALLGVSLILPIPLLVNRVGSETGIFSLPRLSEAFQTRKYPFTNVTTFASTAFVTATISLALEVPAILKVRKHLKSSTKQLAPAQSLDEFRHDFRLLLTSLITLLPHLLVTAYHVSALYAVFTANSELYVFVQNQYTWVTDVASLSGSPALFAMSPAVRREYMRFYRVSYLRRIFGASQWTTTVVALQ